MSEKLYIALFAGTTEGRNISERIAYTEGYSHIAADVFVATEYGREELPETDRVKAFCGRLDSGQMKKVFSDKKYDIVVDATHPYATEVTANIRKACDETGTEYLRVLRDDDENTEDMNDLDRQPTDADHKNPGEKTADPCETVFVKNADEAVSYLENTEGNILVTTGSKELREFLKIPDWKDRVYTRVLSTVEAVSECSAIGFRGRHLIAMEGPFSEEMNIATIRMTDAKWVVTKESGKNGGFEEKRRAAAETGSGLIVIERPVEEGVSLQYVLRRLKAGIPDDDKNSFADRTTYDINNNMDYDPGTHEMTGSKVGLSGTGDGTKTRKIWLIGIGPGAADQMTVLAEEILESCDLIAGAARNVEALSYLDKPVLKEYSADKVIPFLTENTQYRNIAVVFSGDTGFHSGAGKLFEELKKLSDISVSMVPGISCLNYFFAGIGRPWENVKLLSMHGREADIVKEVSENREVFLIAGAKDAFKKVCGPLVRSGLENVLITVGEDLSLPDEKIYTASPAELTDKEAKPLTVMYIENRSV